MRTDLCGQVKGESNGILCWAAAACGLNRRHPDFIDTEAVKLCHRALSHHYGDFGSVKNVGERALKGR